MAFLGDIVASQPEQREIHVICALVTNNLSEFARVPTLAVEDWSLANVGLTARRAITRT